MAEIHADVDSYCSVAYIDVKTKGGAEFYSSVRIVEEEAKESVEIKLHEPRDDGSDEWDTMRLTIPITR